MILDAIISGRLVRVDPESARLYGAGTTDGVIFIWAANAQEQIGRTAEAAVQEERVLGPRAVAPELLEAIDDLLEIAEEYVRTHRAAGMSTHNEERMIAATRAALGGLET